MMFAPIGTFLIRMDGAMTGSIDGIIAAMVSNMATPIALAAVVFYAVQGLRLANGDPAPLQGFVPQLIRVGVVIWLSSNLSGFNEWVRDIFFTGLPNALASAIGSGTGMTATGVNATAAVFDGLWNQIWAVVGNSWKLSGTFSVTGFVAGISGWITGSVCGLCLVVLAIIWIAARMVLAVIICLAPVLIGCAMFDVTKPIFERAVGKIISLILLQSIGLIIVQILLLGDQWFMAQATTRILASISDSGAFWEAIATLGALVVWFAAGAFAMWQLPAIAYSIGSGIAMSGVSVAPWLLLARGLGHGPSDPPPPSGGGTPSPPPSMSLSLARPALAAPTLSVPAGPPPLASSTRR